MQKEDQVSPWKEITIYSPKRIVFRSNHLYPGLQVSRDLNKQISIFLSYSIIMEVLLNKYNIFLIHIHTGTYRCTLYSIV